MRSMSRIGVWCVLAIMLSACQSLGINPDAVKDFNGRASLVVTNVTGLRQIVLTGLQARRIAPDDAENLNQQADQLTTGLGIARRIHSTNPADGDSRLAIVEAAIPELKAYLCKKVPNDPFCSLENP